MTTFSLAELELGAEATIEKLSLPESDADHLMQLGFLPGAAVRFERTAPLGDPRIYRVEGVDIAIRRETALDVFVTRSNDLRS